jgi:hypothetical protein
VQHAQSSCSAACCVADVAAEHTSVCPPKATAAPITTTPARQTEARAQRLRWPATVQGEAGGRDRFPAHRDLPRRWPHTRGDRRSRRHSGQRLRRAGRTACVASQGDRPRRTGDRALPEAFETGNLNPTRFNERLGALDVRLDALRGQDQALARELSADVPATPDRAALRAVVDHLGRVIGAGDPDRAKALLRILIAELRVNSRSEILPTYRVGAPVVCAQISSVEPTGIEPVTSCLQSRRSPS